MRVKGTCRSANRGGCPSFMPFLHIAKGLPSCLPSSSPVVNFQPIGANFRQKVANVNFSLVCLGVLSGFSETKKGKSEIYFGFEDCRASVVALHLWRWWCPLGAGGALLLSLFGCVPSLLSLPLPSFLLCVWCIAFEYGFISRFKGVFGGFWGADVCLYRLRSLRGLWGFCVRERLGGFMSCGVFAPIFSFFHLLRLSSWALPLLSLACPLGCLASDHGLVLSLFVGCCCFFFPYGI